MGDFQHKAIIVMGHTDTVPTEIIGLHIEAKRFFMGTACKVSEILEGMNSFGYFMVSPDGSKLGWSDHELANAKREQLIVILQQSKRLRWVEVMINNDLGDPGVIRHHYSP